MTYKDLLFAVMGIKSTEDAKEFVNRIQEFVKQEMEHLEGRYGVYLRDMNYKLPYNYLVYKATSGGTEEIQDVEHLYMLVTKKVSCDLLSYVPLIIKSDLDSRGFGQGFGYH